MSNINKTGLGNSNDVNDDLIQHHLTLKISCNFESLK